MRYFGSFLVGLLLLAGASVPAFADDGGSDRQVQDGRDPVIMVADDGGSDLKTRDGQSVWDVILADDGGSD